MTDSRTKWAIFNNPLPLLEIKNPKIISAINSYLPYSTGIEMETPQASSYKKEFFTDIPDIMEVNSSYIEQRYRIPNGLKGLVCLWNICEVCKEYLELNDLSGHHYHIDFSEVYDTINDTRDGLTNLSNLLSNNLEWIEKELEDWKYSGTYNRRGDNWVRWNGLKTLEFRVGNQSFDYPVIVKRIIHANDISRRLKKFVKHPAEVRLESLSKQLIGLQKKKESEVLSNIICVDIAQEVIKSRNIKI